MEPRGPLHLLPSSSGLLTWHKSSHRYPSPSSSFSLLAPLERIESHMEGAMFLLIERESELSTLIFLEVDMSVKTQTLPLLTDLCR